MGSCSANRRELEDQIAIKGKCEQIGIRPSWSLIWERKNVRREEKRRSRGRRREGSQERYGNYLSMELLYGWLCFGMELVWKCLYGY